MSCLLPKDEPLNARVSALSTVVVAVLGTHCSSPPYCDEPVDLDELPVPCEFGEGSVSNAGVTWLGVEGQGRTLLFFVEHDGEEAEAVYRLQRRSALPERRLPCLDPNIGWLRSVSPAVSWRDLLPTTRSVRDNDGELDFFPHGACR